MCGLPLSFLPPANVAIHADLSFLLPSAIVNDFVENGTSTFTCVGLPTNGNLMWTVGTVPVNDTNPQTTGPFYVVLVSSREVRLRVFSGRIMDHELRCMSQESGLAASMLLTTTSNDKKIAGATSG